MPLRRPESALVVIYDQQGRVLVLQRQDDSQFWQSVTGTLEPDEQAPATALREVLEETGIDIVANHYTLVDQQQTNQYIIRRRWQYRYPVGTTTNTEHVFSVEVTGNDNIQLSEHTAFLWLSKADAMAKVWSDTNRQAIADYVPEMHQGQP
jgi:dATP pyrophosphohydrolase